MRLKCPSIVLILTGIGIIIALDVGQCQAQDRANRSVLGSRRSLRLAGTYTRIKRRKDENQSALLTISPMRDNKLKFHLTALWWPVGNSASPHNGEIEAIITLSNHVAVYKSGGYRLTMRFREAQVVLMESGGNPDFGAYVSAAGTYQRTNRNRSAKQGRGIWNVGG